MHFFADLFVLVIHTCTCACLNGQYGDLGALQYSLGGLMGYRKFFVSQVAERRVGGIQTHSSCE